MSIPYEPGAPVKGMIPLSVPEIHGNEWAYVKQCLDTGWVSSVGSFVDRFEDEIAACLGVNHAVATVNGTAALHIALLVAGVQPDEEVLVSTLTFIAPVNAIRYVGAWPVFIDAEPDYWQMSPQHLVDFLERGCAWKDGVLRNRVTGRRVRAIIPVHILGHPVDMDPIMSLARKFDLTVIEDACEGLGARYHGRMVGQIGDISCLSFNGNKLLTTGGGGMIATNRDDWAARARYLTTQAKDDPLEYIHGEIGYNYRLTNVQAAIGCAQLEHLSEYVARKREIAACYRRELANTPGLSSMQEAPGSYCTFWMYTILVNPGEYGETSRDLLRRLARRGIQARPLWQPMHQSPAHQDAAPSLCPIAERVHSQALSLPCSVGLSPGDQLRVIESLVDRLRGIEP